MNTATEFDGWTFQEDVRMFYIEDLKERLGQKGYYNIDIYYAINGQGSGACIEAKVNPIEFIKAHGLYNEFRSTYMNNVGMIKLKSNSPHYYHAETMIIENRGKYMYDHCRFVTEKCYNELPEFLDWVLGQSKDYANEFYNNIHEEYLNRL